MSSSSANSRELDANNTDAELTLWRQLIFDPADMAPPHNRPPQFHAPPQLPPETYTYLVQALLSLQGSAHPHSHPPASPYPALPSSYYPWLRDAAPSAPGPSSFYPTGPLIPPQGTSSSQFTSPPAASSTTALTTQDPDATENDISVAEDKRRRNTAASARFRVKKKLKALNLEHTIADLTGRMEELEREATDLRRENTWLKEIVLLKGRNLALNLASQAPAPGNRSDEEEGDDRKQAERGGKGKERED